MINKGCDIGMDIIMNLAKIPYYGTHEEKEGNNIIRKRNYAKTKKIFR